MLENYILYLNYITAKIQKFFDEQKEYICCRKGCAKCCITGQYPYTEIEYKLIQLGFSTLDDDTKYYVEEKIKNILADKKKHEMAKSEEVFRYECPFLINNVCSVYNHRGIICRIFGLMSFKMNSEEKPKIPFCAYEGLNYSQVLDKEHNNLPPEKFEKLGFKEEPKAYNIDYATLTDSKIADGFGFEFGKAKPLIDWIEESL